MNEKGIGQAIYNMAFDLGYKSGYKKALQDFIVLAKEKFPNDEIAIWKLEQIAEQLKGEQE